ELSSRCSEPPADLHSFPPRRSSDLSVRARWRAGARAGGMAIAMALGLLPAFPRARLSAQDTTRVDTTPIVVPADSMNRGVRPMRSEEHTSELQSRGHLVCRLLLEKK